MNPQLVKTAVDEWPEENLRSPLALQPHSAVHASATEASFRATCAMQAERAYPLRVTFWRGRVALYAILKCLGVGAGDAVLVPGYTCFAVPQAVLFTGAIPIYADIAAGAFNIFLATIQAVLHLHRVANLRAILVQHTYGIPANTAPILAWARARGIAIIEDCAHVSGSRYLDEAGEWREVGSAGDAAFYSSQWTKPISTGLGGWATASDPELETALLRFREEQCCPPPLGERFSLAAQRAAYKIVSRARSGWHVKRAYNWLYSRGLLLGTSTKAELCGEMPARFAMRMSAMQSRLLCKKLAGAAHHAHARALRISYDRALESIRFQPLAEPAYADSVLLRYPVRVPEKQRILAEARRRKIEMGDWYSRPVDRPESLRDKTFGYREGMCPEAERAAAEVVNLPMHGGVTPRIVSQVAGLLKEFR